ncbi:hypothetical protein JCM33374_g4883 [Metschnikowia sp. JCM 33374]|nr:hypothetical protein JCM33374_g4883 [Metschnikowia sp. JCM 33374]
MTPLFVHVAWTVFHFSLVSSFRTAPTTYGKSRHGGERVSQIGPTDNFTSEKYTLQRTSPQNITSQNTSLKNIAFGNWTNSIAAWKPINDQNSPLYNETADVAESLEWFFAQLKSFIMESHFDTFRFGVVKEKLAQDRSDIQALAGSLLFENEALFQQFQFVTDSFNAMVNAFHTLEFYNNVSGSEQYIINQMVNLRIRLMKFLDSQGVLEGENVAGEQAKAILEHWHWFQFWKQNFQASVGFQDSEKDTFQYYAYQTEKLLLSIWTQATKHLNKDVKEGLSTGDDILG